MMNITSKQISWLFFLIVLIVTIQFFWVFQKYKVIESTKVIWWVIKFGLPVFFVANFLLINRLTYLLFYSYFGDFKKRKKRVDKWKHFKNKFVIFTLCIMTFCFFTYDTIIQTNDWFSSDTHYTFNQKVSRIDAHKYEGLRRRRWIRRQLGSPDRISYDLHLTYKSRKIILSTNSPWKEGILCTLTVNSGGLWGILYTD